MAKPSGIAPRPVLGRHQLRSNEMVAKSGGGGDTVAARWLATEGKRPAPGIGNQAWQAGPLHLRQVVDPPVARSVIGLLVATIKITVVVI